MLNVTLNNGIQIPIIGFGTAGLQGLTAKKTVLTAIEVGYRMIDTAQMYGNEKEVGKAILKSGVKRNELFVVTKLNSSSNSYNKAKIAINKSLENLQLDYIDLILIHEPYNEALEMYQALIEAYKLGKTRAIGVSNFNKRHLEILLKNCEVIPTINQIESHIFYPQFELKEYLEQNNIKTQSWGAFTSGNKNLSNQVILKEIGAKYGKTANQIALKYLVQNKIIVIPKSSNKEHMLQNMDIFDFDLTIEDLKIIKTLDNKKTLYEWTNNWK